MAAIFTALADARLIKLINEGAIGLIPTDTVYGLVCKAGNKEAVKKLYGLKNRRDKPGTIIAANIEQLVKLGIKRPYVKAVEHFWPNALSIIVPSTSPATAYLRQKESSLAARIPKGKELQQLLAKTGPLLTTSANPSGEQPASTMEQAAVYFGADLDFYVNGGDLSKHEPSTIIRVIDDAIEVVREGAVKIKNNKVVAK